MISGQNLLYIRTALRFTGSFSKDVLQGYRFLSSERVWNPIYDFLRELVSSVKFKKREKHRWRSVIFGNVTFRKFAGF